MQLFISSFLCELVAGLILVIGFAGDVPPFVLAGWIVGGLAGLAMFIGIIAIGVEMGVRAARST